MLARPGPLTTQVHPLTQLHAIHDFQKCEYTSLQDYSTGTPGNPRIFAPVIVQRTRELRSWPRGWRPPTPPVTPDLVPICRILHITNSRGVITSLPSLLRQAHDFGGRPLVIPAGPSRAWISPAGWVFWTNNCICKFLLFSLVVSTRRQGDRQGTRRPPPITDVSPLRQIESGTAVPAAGMKRSYVALRDELLRVLKPAPTQRQVSPHHVHPTSRASALEGADPGRDSGFLTPNYIKNHLTHR